MAHSLIIYQKLFTKNTNKRIKKYAKTVEMKNSGCS